MRLLSVAAAAAVSSAQLISTGVTEQVLTTLPGASRLSPGDFDGDAHTDVAVAFDGGLEILFGNGRTQRIVNATSLSIVEACDVDGDETLDLLASGLAMDGIVWWRNEGGNASRWTPGNPIAPSAGLGTIDLDCRLVVANFFEDQVTEYVNLTTKVVLGNNLFGVTTIFSADVDGDELIDVVSGDENQLVWFTGAAETTEASSPRVISFENGGISDCWATDVNRDSRVDVVHASAASDEIVLHLNSNGLGTIWERQVVTNAAGSVQSIAVQDISRARYLDIFAANFRDNQVAWYVYSAAGDWEMRIVSSVVVEATHLAVVVEEDAVYSVGDSVVRRHDLELVPAPTPAPTITSLPTTFPTASPEPTIVPSPHPTVVPTVLEPEGKKSSRLICLETIKSRAGACRNRNLAYLAMYTMVLIVLVLVFLRLVIRLLYILARPYLIRYEPYYLPKLELAVHKWKKSRLRKCLCCCCPKCCMWPDDEDPLNPSDGVALKQGDYCPARVVTEVPRSVKRIHIIKTGVREVTVL